MNKIANTLAVVAAVAGVTYGVYMLTYGRKHRHATALIKLGKTSAPMATLHSYDEKYLKEWARAAKNNLPTFSYQGKIFNTQGGKAKTN